jgi:hypothetical protein
MIVLMIPLDFMAFFCEDGNINEGGKSKEKRGENRRFSCCVRFVPGFSIHRMIQFRRQGLGVLLQKDRRDLDSLVTVQGNQ